MPTNAYNTAAAILQKLSDRGTTDPVTVRDVQHRMSKGQLAHFERGLEILASTGTIEILPPPTGNRRKGRSIRLLNAPPPEPHCDTCTCHDIL